MDRKKLLDLSTTRDDVQILADGRAGTRCILLFEKVESDAIMFAFGAGEVDFHFVVRTFTKEGAREIAHTLKLHMIVLGCTQMSDEEFNLLQELREFRHLHDIPIVILAQQASEAQIRLAFELGTDRFFFKPTTDEAYIACCRAVASLESNLDVSTMQFEQFPQKCEGLGQSGANQMPSNWPRYSA
jgi:DNA-binding NarL/FixJ family response regulator